MSVTARVCTTGKKWHKDKARLNEGRQKLKECRCCGETRSETYAIICTGMPPLPLSRAFGEPDGGRLKTLGASCPGRLECPVPTRPARARGRSWPLRCVQREQGSLPRLPRKGDSNLLLLRGLCLLGFALEGVDDLAGSSSFISTSFSAGTRKVSPCSKPCQALELKAASFPGSATGMILTAADHLPHRNDGSLKKAVECFLEFVCHHATITTRCAKAISVVVPTRKSQCHRHPVITLSICRTSHSKNMQHDACRSIFSRNANH